MSDLNQYPPTTGFRRILPTLANAKISKFKPSTGFAETEELTDETGATWMYNGINKKFEYDIELYPLSGFTEPVQYSSLQFTAPTVAGAFPYPGVVGGHINIVVISKVESATDDAGKIVKISFKGETTSNTPNPNS